MRLNRIRTDAYRLWLIASPFLGRALGSLVGAVAGLYGAAAGFLIGFMLDKARERKRLAAELRGEKSGALDEIFEGLAAATALALRGNWSGSTDGVSRDGGNPRFIDTKELTLRRELFALVAAEGLASTLEKKAANGSWKERLLRRRIAREIERDLAAAWEEEATDTAALARRLALDSSEAVRRLLPSFAYALAGRAEGKLEHERERASRTLLADAGLGEEAIRGARSAAFPSYRDPWQILELEPGASAAERKRVFRRLSRRCHPDGALAREPAEAPAAFAGPRGEDPAGEFRKIREAYESLSRD